MRVLISIFALVLMVSVNGCEVSTTATIHQGPTFALDGSGTLVSFSIYGPRPDHKIAIPNDAKSLVWSINPLTGYRGNSVTRMEVTYAKVPTGYLQTIPTAGTPPELNSGLVYRYFAETTGAAGAEGFFYMDKTTPIAITVPYLCASAFVGDVKAIKCGTGEPYTEPKDLEQFVKEHRID